MYIKFESLAIFYENEKKLLEQYLIVRQKNPMVTSTTYPIIEIFDSIQGEGLYLGTPTTFIRFAGCNLRCEWCDTKNSWEIGPRKSIDQILSQIHKSYVVFTGGEPTLYNLTPLIIELKKKENIKIGIETNGTNPIHENFDWITCSPKPGANYIINCKPNELKYVVDKHFSVEVIPDEYKKKIPIWLQPNSEDLKESMKLCIKYAMNYDYLRVGIQLHKIYQIK